MSSWTVRTARRFDKSIVKIDRPSATRILDYLEELAQLADPRTRGKALTGNLSGLWRYRVGDYRVLAEIRESELVVLALDIGHRSSVYDK